MGQHRGRRRGARAHDEQRKDVERRLAEEDAEFPALPERFFTTVRSGAFTVLMCEALMVESSSAGVHAVVTWNFRHLVQLRRIRGFHPVNVLRGYPRTEIRSPLEVIDDEA